MGNISEKIKEIEKALAYHEELIALAKENNRPEDAAYGVLVGIRIGYSTALDMLKGVDNDVVLCQITSDCGYHNRQEDCPYYGKYANDPKSSRFLMTAF